jgi:hypothetical protein
VSALAVVRSFHPGKPAKAVLTFTDRRGGRHTVTTADVASRPRPGDVITILYDRKDPSAVTDPRLGLGNQYVFAWLMTAAATVLDLVMLRIAWTAIAGTNHATAPAVDRGRARTPWQPECRVGVRP